jgi:hypothetical protein
VRAGVGEHMEMSGCGLLVRCGWTVRMRGGSGARAGAMGGRGGDVQVCEGRSAAEGAEGSGGQARAMMEAGWMMRPWLIRWPLKLQIGPV